MITTTEYGQLVPYLLAMIPVLVVLLMFAVIEVGKAWERKR